jgi:DNA-binding FadR family transcriptional regulator
VTKEVHRIVVREAVRILAAIGRVSAQKGRGLAENCRQGHVNGQAALLECGSPR